MLGKVVLKSSLEPHGKWVPAIDGESLFFCAEVGEPVAGKGKHQYRRTAFAWGEKAYVMPIWSTVETGLESKDGYAWFAWRPTMEGWQNSLSADAPTYIVMLNPDGTVEERQASEAGIVGGKPYFVRPADCGLPPGSRPDLADKEVLVWNGVSGRPLKEIRHIVDSHGVPVCLGRSDGEWWMGSTLVVVRHPEQTLYEGRDEVVSLFSDTPDARPTASTVRGMGPRLILQADGSVVWAAMKKSGLTTVYRDGKAIYTGRFIAFHRGSRGKVLTIIGRNSRRNGRTIQKIGR